MPAESRARRRIRQAVELFGYRLVRLDWEPIGLGAEKSGPDGGWMGEIERPDGTKPDINKGEGEHLVMGYGVEHVLDWIDEFVQPVEPCGHGWSSELSLARKRTQVQTHPEGCRYHLTYSLPWFAPGSTPVPAANVSEGLREAAQRLCDTYADKKAVQGLGLGWKAEMDADDAFLCALQDTRTALDGRERPHRHVLSQPDATEEAGR